MALSRTSLISAGVGPAAGAVAVQVASRTRALPPCRSRITDGPPFLRNPASPDRFSPLPLGSGVRGGMKPNPLTPDPSPPKRGRGEKGGLVSIGCSPDCTGRAAGRSPGNAANRGVSLRTVRVHAIQRWSGPRRAGGSRHVPQDSGNAAALQVQFAEQGMSQPAAAGIQRQDDTLQFIGLCLTVLDPETHTLSPVRFSRPRRSPQVESPDSSPRQRAPAETSLDRQRTSIGTTHATKELIPAGQQQLILAWVSGKATRLLDGPVQSELVERDSSAVRLRSLALATGDAPAYQRSSRPLLQTVPEDRLIDDNAERALRELYR